MNGHLKWKKLKISITNKKSQPGDSSRKYILNRTDNGSNNPSSKIGVLRGHLRIIRIKRKENSLKENSFNIQYVQSVRECTLESARWVQTDVIPAMRWAIYLKSVRGQAKVQAEVQESRGLSLGFLQW
ncbi:hypothetical protein AJ87_00285 [Rhizobium yanglingense]|nr:hypothetical protein AJ87_00285 [Rhizobium yanglingense]